MASNSTQRMRTESMFETTNSVDEAKVSINPAQDTALRTGMHECPSNPGDACSMWYGCYTVFAASAGILGG